MRRILMLATLMSLSCTSAPPPEPAAEPREIAGLDQQGGDEVDALTGHPRPATIAAIERAGRDRGRWLRAALTGAGRDQIRVGEKIAFEFRSDRDAHLTVIHVDGEGNLTILVPNEANIDGKIGAAQPVRFPPDDPLDVILPIGPESVFAFATGEPLSPAQLGLPRFVDGYAALDPTEGPAFADCLATHLRGARETSAFARLDYLVRSEAGELPYTQKDVEEYFLTTMRSVRRPTLDLLIHFEHDSAELTKEARARLDEVGKALAGDGFSGFSFRLSGHTDDVGADEYNRSLSQRRADAARKYMVAQHGVDGSHLKSVGHGEGRPKIPSTDKSARDENRRVELELESRGTRGETGPPRYQCGA